VTRPAQLRQSCGLKHKTYPEGAGGKALVWLDSERLPKWSEAQKKAFKAEHTTPMWQASWNAACSNATMALIFVSDKWLSSDHCDQETTEIEGNFPKGAVVYVAADQTERCYTFLDKKASNRNGCQKCYKRNESDKLAAIAYIKDYLSEHEASF
jgi:hypothetical protein